ncbi:HD-GYP domain-containing protein [Salisediminibacterium selenitireducens]|uniref:HD-GYP domain-containing protein n=1 Tax=Salisediminibacterium selenitireducens TaxID=85683 RepID=UPI00015F9530|nr:HD domain-containing phosphohydrolase [Salisediminibacterium selenitireducens]
MVHIAMIDETKAYRYRSQVEYLSFHDQLTGLFNRRYFDQALQEITQGNNHPVSLIIADVNGLKLVNDTYGHVTGDALISEVGHRLKSVIREDDVLARHGGDEFAIIMPGVGEEAVKETIMKLDAYCEDVIMKDIKLSVAFGYATNHSPAQSIQAVFQLAEDRMYTNKLYKKTSRRNDLINGMMATLYEKNPREKEHSERVSLLSVNLAKAAGLDESAIQRIRTAGLLHDIGKIAIDYSVLQSDKPLNELEKEEIRKHAEIGYRILNASSEFSELAEIVLCHHERMDGTGYPRQLTGNEIPTESKIIAIANAYDAMITKQTYREPVPVNEAVDELRKGAGTQFDPVLAKLFIDRVIPDEGDRL